MPGDERPEEAGRWRTVGAKIMMSVDNTVRTIFLVQPPRQDLTMPVNNCNLPFCGNGKQLQLGDCRSLN